jgi:hypothetical protein
MQIVGFASLSSLKGVIRSERPGIFCQSQSIIHQIVIWSRNQSLCCPGTLRGTWTEIMCGSWPCSDLLADPFIILKHYFSLQRL